MAGIPVVKSAGPDTCTPADNVVIAAGQLVAATTGGRVTVAGAGSLKVLGVALNDAIAPEDVVTEPAGTPPTLAAVPQATTVAVAYGGVTVPVTYAANAAYGDKLVAAADGTVTPFTGFAAGQDQANVNFALIVGICAEPAGVTVSTQAVGLMRTL